MTAECYALLIFRGYNSVRLMSALFNQVNGQLVVAIVVAGFSMVTYVLTRRRELAWRRTEFLFSQSQYLDNNPELVEVITILENRHASLTLGQIFDPTSELDEAKRKEYLQRFDKLLNFLWRLCFACLKTKTLSDKEINGFGWYFWRISQSPLIG